MFVNRVMTKNRKYVLFYLYKKPRRICVNPLLGSVFLLLYNIAVIHFNGFSYARTNFPNICLRFSVIYDMIKKNRINNTFL